MIEVLVVDGTWVPHGSGPTDAFIAALGEGFRATWVDYPADYGRTVDYVESRKIGYDNLVATAAALDGPLLLAGYSQGAGIAGDLAADIAIGRHPQLASKVLGVALIADPLRPAGRQIEADPGGYGISGQRPIVGIPAWWAAAPRDPITALDAGNAVRTVADLTGYWCMRSPEAFVRWGESVIIALALAGHILQPWWRFWTPWDSATAAIADYLFRGRHTDAYVDEGHAARLGATVRAAVRA